MVICAPKRGVSSPTKADRKTTRKENNMPDRPTLIKFLFTLIVLSFLHFGHPAAFSEKNTPR